MTTTENPEVDHAKAEFADALIRLKKVVPEFGSIFPNLEGSLPKEQTQRKGTATTDNDIEKLNAKERRCKKTANNSIESPRLNGFGYLYKRGNFWWIRYSVRGKDFRESSKSEHEKDAMKLLKRRWKEVGKGRFIGPSEERVTMDSLFDALKLDYQNNQRRSTTTLEGRLRHLRAVFGNDRAIDVTEERIEAYKAKRLAETTERGGKRIQPGTVNRELATLRKAFRLAVRQKRIATAPTIELLEENNVRQGFVEPKDFESIARWLPEHLRDFSRFAYFTGWRKGELQTLGWLDVNREAQIILLRPEHSKNKEPRLLPLTSELADLIERRWQARAFKNKEGIMELAQFVFHCGDGRPIGDIRKSWNSACKKAGMLGLLFHDLRRSAIRNFDRAGVSQTVGMVISGHKTPSVYRRYRITTEQDIREALERTQASLTQNQQRHVVAIEATKESGIGPGANRAY